MCAVLVLVVVLLLLTPAGAPADWELLTTEEGIEVSRLQIPGRALPVLRGIGIVEAEPVAVLEVLRDIPRQTEWMYSCEESKVLRREGETILYVYNRTNLPWPVADRDVVVRSEAVTVEFGREIHVFFRTAPEERVEPRDGIVRMPRLEGHWKLAGIDPGRTRVEYQVDADPGGQLPAWLVRMLSRDVPAQTLVSLREQVARRQGGEALPSATSSPE